MTKIVKSFPITEEQLADVPAARRFMERWLKRREKQRSKPADKMLRRHEDK